MLQDDVYLGNNSIRRIDPLILHVVLIIEHAIIILIIIGDFGGLSGRKADIVVYGRFGNGSLQQATLSLLVAR